MEQSVDKRLEAIEILRRWISVKAKEDAHTAGEARVFLEDGCGGVCELICANYEAELLMKVLND